MSDHHSAPLAELDATAQADLVRTGSASPTELVSAAIARIEALNPTLNAVIQPRFDAALNEAAGDLPDGPFRGVPLLLKDLGAQLAGEPYHTGAKFLKAIDWRAAADGHLVTRLKQAGFVILGRTNTPEFGSSCTTEPEAYGPTRNPWNPDHSAGGSSGGSAAAVASRMVPLAHASDGGGSIRIPASACGLFGLKPSRGRISRGPQQGEGWGGASTDGCLSLTVRDTAAFLDVVQGAFPGDPYTAPPPARPYTEELRGLGAGRSLRIGLLDHPLQPGFDPDDDCTEAVHATAALLESLGHRVDVAWPAALDDPAFGGHYVNLIMVAAAQWADSWGRELGRSIGPEDVEASNWLFAELGRGVSGSDYLDSLGWLHGWSRRLAAFWDDHDLLLTPTLGCAPVRIGELVPDPADPMPTMLRVSAVIPYTAQFNVSGQPAMSLPLHHNAAGLPIGTQLVAAQYREDLLLSLAADIERIAPWIGRHPAVCA